MNLQIEEEIKEIKKKIEEKNQEIREIFELSKEERKCPKTEIIDSLKGIKRTTGQHPGGLLITLPDTDIKKFTPLNFPADNTSAE
jgi:DNA polymerase III alpha subunit (gram-positive type)